MFFFFDTGGSRLRLRLDEPPPAIGHRPSGLKVPLANGSQIFTQPLARLNYHLAGSAEPAFCMRAQASLNLSPRMWAAYRSPKRQLGVWDTKHIGTSTHVEVA